MTKHERKATNAAIWLFLENYHVTPLKPWLAGHRAELERAIRRGIPAQPDWRHHTFYKVELESGWAYIHVRDQAKTVYLVAHFPFHMPANCKLLPVFEHLRSRLGLNSERDM
jgi:hypothetical protein